MYIDNNSIYGMCVPLLFLFESDLLAQVVTVSEIFRCLPFGDVQRLAQHGELVVDRDLLQSASIGWGLTQ